MPDAVSPVGIPHRFCTAARSSKRSGATKTEKSKEEENVEGNPTSKGGTKAAGKKATPSRGRAATKKTNKEVKEEEPESSGTDTEEEETGQVGNTAQGQGRTKSTGSGAKKAGTAAVKLETSKEKLEEMGKTSSKLETTGADKETENPSPTAGTEAGETKPANKASDGVKKEMKTEKSEDPVIDNSPTFPEKLMELLQNDDLTDAIWWLPDEESFAIDKENFEKKVLTKYFRGNKFTSITRNLNRWYVRNAFCTFYSRIFQL